MNDETYKLQRAMQLAMMDECEIFDIERRRAYNELLPEYFERLRSDIADRSLVLRYATISDDGLEHLQHNVTNCNSYWDWDVHFQAGAMELKRMNNCHSRYCPNCQKLIQGTRLGNFYAPIMRTATKEGVKLYMATFTVPNPPLQDLRFTLDVMREAFAKLIMFLDGRESLRGYDFSAWGYRAAVCSFECTYNNQTFTGHPHFHAVFALSDTLDNVKKHVNDYSVKYGVVVDLFSDNEIFLQKLWRLLVDRITVRRILQAEQDFKQRKHIAGFKQRLAELKATRMDFGQTPFLTVEDITRKKKSGQIKAQRIRLQEIYDLDIGYSVQLEPVDGDNFKQAFKYAFKLINDKHDFLTYDVFAAFFDQFFKKHTIQGYGEWRNIDCSDRISEISATVFKGLRELLSHDQAVRVSLSPDESVQYAKTYGLKMLSTSAVRAMLLDLSPEELLAVSEDFKAYRLEHVSLDEMIADGGDPAKKEILARFFARVQALRERRRQDYAGDAVYDRIAALHLDLTPKSDHEKLSLSQMDFDLLNEIF